MPTDLLAVAWRRRLPHLQRIDRTYFITFVTRQRGVLSPAARTSVLNTIVDGHERSFSLHSCVVMPDHVHMIATIFDDTTLPAVVKFIKSVSTKRISDRSIWQREYYDRILRRDEDLRRTCEYVIVNPMRAGLVDAVDDYPWIWRYWVEGERAPQRDCGAPTYS
jgi:REP element-mobilizing transposase RayT